MKGKVEKNLICFWFVILVSGMLCGCQGSESVSQTQTISNVEVSETEKSSEGIRVLAEVPEINEIAELSAEEIEANLKDYTRKEIVSAWDEPDYEIFGSEGELYFVQVGGKSLVMFYEGVEERVKAVQLCKDSYIGTFTGTVEEDWETEAVIIVDEECDIRNSGSRVRVKLIDENEMFDVEIGDKVYVEYVGPVMESSPLQLTNQVSMSITEHATPVANMLFVDDELEGVSMTLKEVTPISAKLEILNTTDRNIQYGETYMLQSLQGETWTDVPYLISNYAFAMIAYRVPKNEVVEWSVNWETFHGELEPGTYRLVKDINDFRATADFTKYSYKLEFEIPEE